MFARSKRLIVVAGDTDGGSSDSGSSVEELEDVFEALSWERVQEEYEACGTSFAEEVSFSKLAPETQAALRAVRGAGTLRSLDAATRQLIMSPMHQRKYVQMFKQVDRRCFDTRSKFPLKKGTYIASGGPARSFDAVWPGPGNSLLLLQA